MNHKIFFSDKETGIYFGIEKVADIEFCQSEGYSIGANARNVQLACSLGSGSTYLNSTELDRFKILLFGISEYVT